MNYIEWIWTDHLFIVLKERNLSIEQIETAITHPDEIIAGYKGRTIFQKVFNEKLLRVIAENDRLITAYLTSKKAKYLKVN